MGLFSSISRAVGGLVSDVGGAVSGLLTAAAPLVTALAPIAISAIQARAGAFSPAGGAGAIGAAALQGGRPPLGVLGSQSPFANPIARAQFFPPFNPATIPARPLQAENARLTALIQQLLGGQAPQTTSFNQGAFGSTIGPGFRPFAPSFRSGQVGFSGGFRPGISRGLAPQFQQPFQPQFQPQFQQQFQAPRQFGGFGGGGFGGFGGFGRFGGFGF